MANLKQQMLSGVFYTAVAKYSGIIISLIITAVLARMLSPDDFGVVAVASVIINFFNIFTNIGFSTAIVQNKELTQNDLNNIYSFTLWLGVILGVYSFQQQLLFPTPYSIEIKILSSLLIVAFLYK